MNPRHFTSLVAAGVLLLPAAAFAQTSPAFPSTGSSGSPSQGQYGQPAYGTASQHPAAGSVARVNQDQLSRTFTARDLIGKNVFNHEGERLGTINDVSLSKAWVERFGAPNREQSSDQQGQQPFGSPASSSAYSPSSGSDLTVYVSTGGVLGLQGRFGVRADWVAVSADALMYDRHNDRFILNLPQAQFTAIAQGRSGTEVYAQGQSSYPTYGSGSGTIGAGSSSSGSMSQGQIGRSSADVRQIENALANHQDLRGRSRIQVSHAGNAIQLSGVVDNVDLLRRAGDIARQQTNLEVRNMLEVGRPFATE
jgi:osmotically-inducible protein OsmY